MTYKSPAVVRHVIKSTSLQCAAYSGNMIVWSVKKLHTGEITTQPLFYQDN